jgi:hypothetical protein
LLCAVPIVTHVHGQSGVFDWANGYTEVRAGHRQTAAAVTAAAAPFPAAAANKW